MPGEIIEAAKAGFLPGGKRADKSGISAPGGNGEKEGERAPCAADPDHLRNRDKSQRIKVYHGGSREARRGGRELQGQDENGLSRQRIAKKIAPLLRGAWNKIRLYIYYKVRQAHEPDERVAGDEEPL